MRDNVTDRLVRTVIVRFPDGDKQYWLTEETFVVGDAIRARNGQTLVVEEVLDPAQSGTYMTVKLAEVAA
jgi:hypothetical protein